MRFGNRKHRFSNFFVYWGWKYAFSETLNTQYISSFLIFSKDTLSYRENLDNIIMKLIFVTIKLLLTWYMVFAPHISSIYPLFYCICYFNKCHWQLKHIDTLYFHLLGVQKYCLFLKCLLPPWHMFDSDICHGHIKLQKRCR